MGDQGADKRIAARPGSYSRVFLGRKPRTVVWPEAPFDTLVVAEEIRRNVTPRQPAYRRLDDGPSRRHIETICREINSVVARNLRMLRVRAGLRQVDLAATVGMTAATICRIERAKRSITFPELVRIATQLGVPIEAFIDPPADHVPTGWVRATRLREMSARELHEYERAIFEEEVEDLMEDTGKTRQQLEEEWFGLDGSPALEGGEKERDDAWTGMRS